MGTLVENNSAESVNLIERARSGDREALNALLTRHRGRLRRMVEVRLDTRLQARLDASNVVQEALAEAAGRLDEYLRDPKLPLFLWLRLVVGEWLVRLHRQHLGTQIRDPGHEISLYQGALPAANSAALAAQLLGRHTSPTQAVHALDPMDREIVSLRHFEELKAAEAARVLGIEESAAAKRYFRALKRLKEILADMAGGEEGFRHGRG
jgi:RNA polymerase sigma-70 factor (ECF subfamily)